MYRGVHIFLILTLIIQADLEFFGVSNSLKKNAHERTSSQDNSAKSELLEYLRGGMQIPNSIFNIYEFPDDHVSPSDQNGDENTRNYNFLNKHIIEGDGYESTQTVQETVETTTQIIILMPAEEEKDIDTCMWRAEPENHQKSDARVAVKKVVAPDDDVGNPIFLAWRCITKKFWTSLEKIKKKVCGMFDGFYYIREPPPTANVSITSNSTGKGKHIGPVDPPGKGSGGSESKYDPSDKGKHQGNKPGGVHNESGHNNVSSDNETGKWHRPTIVTAANTEPTSPKVTTESTPEPTSPKVTTESTPEPTTTLPTTPEPTTTEEPTTTTVTSTTEPPEEKTDKQKVFMIGGQLCKDLQIELSAIQKTDQSFFLKYVPKIVFAKCRPNATTQIDITENDFDHHRIPITKDFLVISIADHISDSSKYNEYLKYYREKMNGTIILLPTNDRDFKEGKVADDKVEINRMLNSSCQNVVNCSFVQLDQRWKTEKEFRQALWKGINEIIASKVQQLRSLLFLSRLGDRDRDSAYFSTEPDVENERALYFLSRPRSEQYPDQDSIPIMPLSAELLDPDSEN